MNIPWVWICFVIEKYQGSEYTKDAQGSEYACLLLNNARIFLNMPEPETKITVQAK